MIDNRLVAIVAYNEMKEVCYPEQLSEVLEFVMEKLDINDSGIKIFFIDNIVFKAVPDAFSGVDVGFVYIHVDSMELDGDFGILYNRQNINQDEITDMVSQEFIEWVWKNVQSVKKEIMSPDNSQFSDLVFIKKGDLPKYIHFQSIVNFFHKWEVFQNDHDGKEVVISAIFGGIEYNEPLMREVVSGENKIVAIIALKHVKTGNEMFVGYDRRKHTEKEIERYCRDLMLYLIEQ